MQVQQASMPPAFAPLRGASRLWVSLGLLAAALVTVVPVYGGWLSGGAETAYRFGLPILWGVLALAAARSARLTPLVPALLGLFGVSLGFALAYVVGSRPFDWLGLSAATPPGAAVAKIVSEVLPVCAAIFLSASLAGLSGATLGLRGGRVGLSVGFGLLATIPLVVLFAVDPSGGSGAVLATPATTIVAWLPWIVVFSMANAFMEELWFRGLWFGAFTQAIGSSAAMHVTSWAFCLGHVIVYWGNPAAIGILTPVWLYMGYAYVMIVRRTGSLWGPVLAHGIADVLFLLIAFSSGQGL